MPSGMANDKHIQTGLGKPIEICVKRHLNVGKPCCKRWKINLKDL